MITSRPSLARRMLAAVAGVVLTAGTVAACGSQDEAEFSPDTQQQEDPGPETDEDPADTGAEDQPAGDDPDDATVGDEPAEDDAQAGGEPAAAADSYVRGPQEALHTITYDVPGRDYEVTVGLHTLRVDGEVMLLELSFTPEGNRRTQGIRHFNPTNVLRPVLNDRENLKQYTVLTGSGNRWDSTSARTGGVDVESGQTVMYYAYFAAPEDDIDTITVSVIDGLVEFADVEVQW